MARQSRAVGADHNQQLTDDERSALLHYYAVKIRTADKVAVLKKADYDTARSVVNGLFSNARGDLGITRKEFEEVLAAQAMTEAEFRHAEAKRSQRFSLAGLPVGTQLDMFGAGAADTVDEQAGAEQDGFRAGRRADDPVPPDHIAPILHPDWMAGWHRGQEANAADFLKAQGILDARDASKQADGDDAADEPVGDVPEEDEDEVIDKAARRLKQSGFTERSAEPEPAEAA